MPNELHDALNKLVVVRRQTYNTLVPYTEAPIDQGKKIHDAQWIYGLYGAIDGLSGSFSMMKYFFDVYYANSSLSSADVSDVFHDVMMMPVGMVVVSLGVAVFVGVSIIANQFNGSKMSRTDLENAPIWPYIKQKIVEDWPYIRDSMKALKNGYKGVRNAFVFLNLLGYARDFRYMMMPMGLVLGMLSAYNRPWLRQMRSERGRREKKNGERYQEHLKEMASQRDQGSNDVNMPEMIPEMIIRQWEVFQQAINKERLKDKQIFHEQSTSKSFSNCAYFGQMTGLWSDQSTYDSFWLYAYFSAVFNGLLDAPYLILGVVSLTALAPAAWVFGVAAFFTVICVATRLYEEQNQQREFLVTQLDVESAFNERKFKGLFAQLKRVSLALLQSNLSDQDKLQLEHTRNEILEALDKHLPDAQACQDKLKAHAVLSFGSLFLCGLKNGVDAFGVIASVMFAVASFYAMTLTPYPPFLLAFFLALGVACLALFVADSLLGHVEHLGQVAADNETPRQTMDDCLQNLKTCAEPNETEDGINTAHTALAQMMTTSRSRPYFYQSWFEVPRLFFSGWGKGIRIVDSLLVSWQVLGSDGHYHDTDNMMLMGKISAVIVAIVFALRGYANVCSKNKKESEDLSSAGRCLQRPPSPVFDRSLSIFPNVNSESALEERGSPHLGH